MTHERNADGLRQSAQQRSQESLVRTDQAITQLAKEGKKINFHTVAEAAGVSVAYLYKHDSIKQRIDHLRKQQFPIKGLPQKQGASDNSRKAIIITLKERIKKLEAENKGLRDHVEVVQGIAMQVTELKQQIEALNAENSKLREQLNQCRSQSEIQLTSTPFTDEKVTSLDKKRIERPDPSDKIKSELGLLGIKLNSTLSKTIKSASVELVLSAIEALKEAMANGDIERPGGWLNKAIKEGWTPNKNCVLQDEWEIFNEWFNLAKKQGLIMASMKGEDGKLYIFTKDAVRLPFDVMLAEHPLNVLRGR